MEQNRQALSYVPPVHKTDREIMFKDERKGENSLACAAPEYKRDRESMVGSGARAQDGT